MNGRIEFRMRKQCLQDAVQAWLEKAQPGLRCIDLVIKPGRWHEVTAVVEDDSAPRDSNTHRVSITSGNSADSALASLAASMPVGTWARLNASNQDAMLGVGPTSGSMIHYCNQMPWNPHRRAIELVAMDHNAGMQRYVRYNELSNAFELVQADDGAGTATRHGYGHNAVNPWNGDLYHRLAEYGYEATGLLVRRYAHDAAAFVNLARVPVLFYMQNAIGSCWWSGPFHGAGPEGCLLVFNSGDSATGGSANDGGMYAYDPMTDQWFWTSRGVAPFYGTQGYTYHSVMAYSAAKNVAVYGGGNDAPRKLWRMHSDRSVVAMPDTPNGATVGIQQGIICEDPVTGNFVLLSGGNVWELNPGGNGTWVKFTDRAPPSGVGVPSAPDGVTCTPIHDHGVIAYITQTGRSGGTMFLYKHA